jgi:hypothetical protein
MQTNVSGPLGAIGAYRSMCPSHEGLLVHADRSFLDHEGLLVYTDCSFMGHEGLLVHVDQYFLCYEGL